MLPNVLSLARSLTVVPMLMLLLAAGAHAQNNRMVYTLSECEEDEGRLQTTTEVWDARPGMEERISCRMGVGCNGIAWTSCGELRTPNEVIATLAGAYLDAAIGDSIRHAAGDFAEHIIQFVQGDTVVHVRSDLVVYYKVYHLGNGTLVFNDPRLARAGTMVAVGVAGSSPGPHLLLACEPRGETVVGYRLFVLPE